MEAAGLFFVIALLAGLGLGGQDDDSESEAEVDPIFDDQDATGAQPDDGNIKGTSGDDLIFGGRAEDGEQDTLDPTNPSDAIDAGAGDDTVFGGPGIDGITGGPGDDLIDGGPGDGDTIFGGAGNDTLLTGDVVDFGSSNIDGEAGDDVLVAQGVGIASLTGGEGNDTILGAEGANIIDPGEGDDSVTGGPDDNLVRLGPGDDTLTMVGTDDILEVASFETTGVDVDFTAGTATGLGGTTNLSGFDLFFGGAGDDTVQGGDDVREILTRGGDDSVIGSDNDEFIDGGAGNDTLEGAGGVDIITTGDGADVVVVGENDRIADFDPANDFIDLTPFYDVLEDARDDLSSGTPAVLDKIGVELIGVNPGDLTTANTGLPAAFVGSPIGPLSDVDSGGNFVENGFPAGTIVGITAFADDPDAGDVVTYSTTTPGFDVDAVTGVVTLSEDLVVDVVSKIIEVEVTASSSDGSSTSKIFGVDAVNFDLLPPL